MCMSGDRAQILDNAVIIYPEIVSGHLDWHKTSIVKPEEIFHIAVTLLPKNDYRAILTYGNPMEPKALLHTNTVHACPEFAVSGLLRQTALLVSDSLVAQSVVAEVEETEASMAVADPEGKDAFVALVNQKVTGSDDAEYDMV